MNYLVLIYLLYFAVGSGMIEHVFNRNSSAHAACDTPTACFTYGMFRLYPREGYGPVDDSPADSSVNRTMMFSLVLAHGNQITRAK